MGRKMCGCLKRFLIFKYNNIRKIPYSARYSVDSRLRHFSVVRDAGRYDGFRIMRFSVKDCFAQRRQTCAIKRDFVCHGAQVVSYFFSIPIEGLAHCFLTVPKNLTIGQFHFKNEATSA
jgi:hypothetical protein